MSGSGIGIVVGSLVVAAVLLMFGVGGFGVTSSDGGSDGATAGRYEAPPMDGSYGVVAAVYQAKSGISLGGWDITPSRWEALVSFVPPAGCMLPEDPAEAMNAQVKASGPCATIPAEGRMSGGGTLEGGIQVWTVAVEISEACHGALQTADHWPTAKPECAAR